MGRSRTRKKSKNHKKDTQGEEVVSEEDSETSSQLSSEDGKRILRDEEIEGKEMAEDEKENLDEEEGKPGIDKEQQREETQQRK